MFLYFKGNADEPASFQVFLYNHIVPSCFVAPSKPEFDMNDAQTMLVGEIQSSSIFFFRV